VRDVVTGQLDLDYPRRTPHAGLVHAHRGVGVECGAFLHECIAGVDVKRSARIAAADGRQVDHEKGLNLCPPLSRAIFSASSSAWLAIGLPSMGARIRVYMERLVMGKG
jgi:hypothetical protein